MDTNKNLYTIIYSTVLVVLVAVVLAIASEGLKEKQQRNIDMETKQSILKSVNLGKEAATATDKAAYIEGIYSKYIVDTTIKEGDKTLPLFICTMDNKDKVIIVPVHGVGLWGAIWGYVALKNDYNTIYGATFDHKGETPGLGAEINTPFFSDPFAGKQIFKDGNYTSVRVVKGGANKADPQEVDAISGGTITSKAVEAMLFDSLKEYMNYFKAQMIAAANATKTVDSTSLSGGVDSLQIVADSTKISTPKK